MRRKLVLRSILKDEDEGTSHKKKQQDGKGNVQGIVES